MDRVEEYTSIKRKPTEEGLDFSFLRQKGIAYIEELSRKLWTDYNRHFHK